MTSGATVSFFWNDAPLRAAAATAYRVSLGEAAAFARSRAEWRHVASTISPTTNGVRVGSSDAGLLEHGARPHEEAPHKQAIKFTHGDGGFVSVAVHHPGMAGHPFMRPTAEAWPAMFTTAARGTFPKAGL